MRLIYKGKSEGCSGDTRVWDVIEPRLPGYDYKYGYPSFGVEGLKERGLI